MLRASPLVFFTNPYRKMQLVKLVQFSYICYTKPKGMASKMRVLLTCILLFISLKSFSQIKMCEENTRMYFKCYQLDSNGTFNYVFGHCTGSYIGIGSYVQSKKTLTFNFDTMGAPLIHGHNQELKHGLVEISYYHLIDKRIMYFEKVLYRQKEYRTDLNGKLVLNYQGGPVIIYRNYGDSVIINPGNEKFNSYDIFWYSSWETYVKKGTKIKMKKRGNRYKLRQRVKGYSERRGYYPKWRTTFYVIDTK
jgi:hypothetical protein